MMIIGKHFEFEASHQLPNEDCYGKCRNLHGHTYKLLIEIQGEVNEKGWIMNFSDLKAIVNELVIQKLDHKHLNDVIADISTAENILAWIVNQIRQPIWDKGSHLHRVTLYETSNSFARIE